MDNMDNDVALWYALIVKPAALQSCLNIYSAYSLLYVQ